MEVRSEPNSSTSGQEITLYRLLGLDQTEFFSYHELCDSVDKIGATGGKLKTWMTGETC